MSGSQAQHLTLINLSLTGSVGCNNLSSKIPFPSTLVTPLWRSPGNRVRTQPLLSLPQFLSDLMSVGTRILFFRCLAFLTISLS